MLNATIDQLRYFVEVSNFQHVGKAAKSIAISPSAISNAISSLERELDCELFTRKSKRIFLTKEGEKLKIQAEQLLASFNALPLVLAEEREGMRGTYKIGVGHFFAARDFSVKIHEVQEQNEELITEVFSLAPGPMVTEIAHGNLDLGLCVSPARHTDIIETPVYKGLLVPVVRREHPLLKEKRAEQIAKLDQYLMASYLSTHGLNDCHNHPILKKYDINPKINFKYNTDEIAIQKLINSDNWSLMPDYIAAEYGAVVSPIALPKDWDAYYRLSLIKHKSRTTDKVLTYLTDYLKDALLNSLYKYGLQ